MKTKLSISFGLLLISFFGFAQERFYATTDAKNAEELKRIFPEEIQILEVKNQSAAVYLTEKAAHYLHKNVITHGPGYVYKNSAEEAKKAVNIAQKRSSVLALTIDQDAIVQSAINQVNADNIKNHIQTLQNYGTRRHNTTQAQTSVQDLKTKWEGIITASGRTDVSVRIVNHNGTAMPSLILTINGTTEPTDYVIVGAHMDSLSFSGMAPGADDDASGIATITEMIRILVSSGYKPKKNVEFMAFAAEEVGLVGSSEIAATYYNQSKNVIAFVQFDMTNYKGSANDIYLTTDSYNSNDLNVFLIELMEHYNASGTHQFSYGNTICNYGCSDHFSWAENGYHAAFPFESSFTQYNPNIHTSQDTLANMGNNANHAAKFAKLGLEFIIEASKSSTLSVDDSTKKDLKIVVDHKMLVYQSSQIKFNQIQLIDSNGRRILEKSNMPNSGSIDLSKIKTGFYLVTFKDINGGLVTKKIILD